MYPEEQKSCWHGIDVAVYILLILIEILTINF